MIVLEVLASFRRASALMSSSDMPTEEEGQAGGDSSGSSYHSPSMDNCILAPYNYSFI